MTGDARQFGLEMGQEFAAMLSESREAVALLALQGLRGVVNKSPVDTGRFKGNWSLSIGTIDTATTELTDPSGAATINKGATAVSAYAAMQGFPVIHLQNSLPYADELEDGRSGQAPQGVLGLTVLELQAQWNGQ